MRMLRPTIQELVETLNAGANCGIGSKGFESGNKCAKGGSGNKASKSDVSLDSLKEGVDKLHHSAWLTAKKIESIKLKYFDRKKLVFGDPSSADAKLIESLEKKYSQLTQQAADLRKQAENYPANAARRKADKQHIKTMERRRANFLKKKVPGTSYTGAQLEKAAEATGKKMFGKDYISGEADTVRQFDLAKLAKHGSNDYRAIDDFSFLFYPSQPGKPIKAASTGITGGERGDMSGAHWKNATADWADKDGNIYVYTGEEIHVIKTPFKHRKP